MNVRRVRHIEPVETPRSASPPPRRTLRPQVAKSGASVKAQALGLVIAAGWGGMTAEELARAMAREADAERPATNQRRRLLHGRLVEMATAGLIENAGRRRGGLVVWVASTATSAERESAAKAE